MTKKKSDRIANPYARKIIVHFRVNSDEMRHILALAAQYFDGNAGMLIRTALKNYRHKK